jgi:hypothetical protein
MLVNSNPANYDICLARWFSWSHGSTGVFVLGPDEFTCVVVWMLEYEARFLYNWTVSSPDTFISQAILVDPDSISILFVI